MVIYKTVIEAASDFLWYLELYNSRYQITADIRGKIMSNYRKYITTKTPKLSVLPSLVNQPIPGREEMVPTGSNLKEGGMHNQTVMGYAFKSSEVNRYKRWLVFGSMGSTMYAASEDITNSNLEAVSYMLYTNYKLALDILQDFSIRNIVKGQKTLLTVLSLALSYDDHTVRLYQGVNTNKLDIDTLVSENSTACYTFSGPVHRITLNNDRSMLYAMIYNKDTEGYRYESAEVVSGHIEKLKERPGNLKWHEVAIKPGFDGKAGVVAIIYSLAVKRYAMSIAPSMIRQSSMLFETVANVHAQRGWGVMMHRLVENFYNGLDNSELAQQFIKYGARQQWSHANLLRKVKPVTMRHSHRRTGLNGQPLKMSQVLNKEDLYVRTPVANPDEIRSKIFAWAVDKFDALEGVQPSTVLNERGYIADPLSKLWAADAMKKAQTAEEIAKIIRDYQMPREAVERANTIWLKDPIVWDALLPSMPGNALVRNLRNMAQIGLVTPMSDAEQFIVDRLTNPKFMGKVHPMQILQAAVTYDKRVFASSYAANEDRSRKHGDSKASYDISQPIVNALNVALHNSYKNVTPTNKRILMAVDISGSMYWNMLDNFFPFFPAEAAAAMALIFAHIETRYMPMVFSDKLEPMKLSNTSSIDDALNELRNHSGASTDIGLPIQYALTKNIPIDAFISITDNETNTGYHPASLMVQYRKKMDIPDSKFITIAMQSNEVTVADPKDPNMLDVAGCSADTQDTVINFINGEF